MSRRLLCPELGHTSAQQSRCVVRTPCLLCCARFASVLPFARRLCERQLLQRICCQRSHTCRAPVHVRCVAAGHTCGQAALISGTAVRNLLAGSIAACVHRHQGFVAAAIFCRAAVGIWAAASCAVPFKCSGNTWVLSLCLFCKWCWGMRFLQLLLQCDGQPWAHTAALTGEPACVHVCWACVRIACAGESLLLHAGGLI